MKRLVCDYCDKRFEDAASRERHSRDKHRKAHSVVRELRVAIRPFAEAAKLYAKGGPLEDARDGEIISVWLPDVTVGHLRRLAW